MKDIHSFVILAYNESPDLEECIRSIKNQSKKTNIVIATSTKNKFILDLASKYSLGVIINDKKSNKAKDYNFAINSVNTELVTIIHQDDLYNRNYAKEILNCYKYNKDASIIFTDNYVIDKDEKIKNNKDIYKRKLFIKLLKYNFFNKRKFFRKLSIKYNNNICSSSVTYVKNNIPSDIFNSKYKYFIEWDGFIKLLKFDKRFVFIDQKLVGYRLDRKNKLDKDSNKEYNLILKKLNNKLIYNLLKKEE